MVSIDSRLAGSMKLHEHFGLAGMGRQLVAPGHQLAHHDFAIDEVLGTTQADETDFQARIQTGKMPSG
jgi:hypothetical protein